MSELESALRRAMADETAGLAIAPDLVERVVRGSDRRHRMRLRLVAVVAAVLVAAGAAPAYVALVPRHQISTGKVLAEVGGVEVGYVPQGFGGRPERIEVKAVRYPVRRCGGVERAGSSRSASTGPAGAWRTPSTSSP
ncbi:hypothetical protein ACQP2K_06835 [Microbispora siamensis]